MLEHPLKTTGEHEVSIKLHHDVIAKFVFQIKSTTARCPKADAPDEDTGGKAGRPEETTRNKINGYSTVRLDR